MGWFIAIAVAVFGFFWIVHLHNEWEFSKVPSVEVECTLLSSNYNPSTLATHAAPIVGRNTSVAIYGTGHGKQYVTVWDCKEYGKLTCEEEEVFRFAKEKSWLKIRSSEYDTRIVGIIK